MYLWRPVSNQPPEWRQTPESRRWMWFQIAVMVAVAWPMYRYSWRVVGGNDDTMDMVAALAVILWADVATVLLSRFIDWARQP
jgi:hypothetical protein